MLTNYQNFDTIFPTVTNQLPKNYIIVIRHSIKMRVKMKKQDIGCVAFKQIKSKNRVRELGEVFTSNREVNAMLDLIPNITIDTTFLEPACGNGNFVVEIMKRKFDLCKKKSDYIRALESVVAIDIMADNIQECKQRVKELYLSYGQKENIDFILDTQIFQGNSLAIMRLIEKCQGGQVVILTQEP